MHGSYKLLKNLPKDTFTSVNYAIYVDGKAVYTKELALTKTEKIQSYLETFNVPVQVKKGSVVDFMAITGKEGVVCHPRLDADICVDNPNYKGPR